MNFPPVPPCPKPPPKNPNSMQYLTADAARKLTASAHDLNGDYKRKETEDILQKIQTIASSGNSVFTTSKIDPIVKTRLEKLGYTVCTHNGDQREDPYVTITWG